MVRFELKVVRFKVCGTLVVSLLNMLRVKLFFLELVESLAALK